MPDDSILISDFLSKGIVKFPVENLAALNKIRSKILSLANPIRDLNNTHDTIFPENLNDFRLAIIAGINDDPDIRQEYFSLAKNAIETLVGNELVMQRNINLSIQLPNDDSSLLPIHADVLQGDSPYEVVLWIPLVDVYDSKAMFFSHEKNIANADHCETFYVPCKYGEALIFSQNYLHGNRVNETNETRWSMNCRFKSALSPYGDKKLGEFFIPISIKAATRLGWEYGQRL